MASTAEGATPSRSRMAREGNRRIDEKLDAARSAPIIRVPELRGNPANAREALRRLKPQNM